jgi:hypothetical protein
MSMQSKINGSQQRWLRSLPGAILSLQVLQVVADYNDSTQIFEIGHRGGA